MLNILEFIERYRYKCNGNPFRFLLSTIKHTIFGEIEMGSCEIETGHWPKAWRADDSDDIPLFAFIKDAKIATVQTSEMKKKDIHNIPCWILKHFAFTVLLV
jgi:hypothetical protein